MSASRSANSQDDRPEFMVVLGLGPPYSIEDVKQAYLQKARSAHPDRGGNVTDFVRLQEAFEQATEYAKFRQSRRHWLGMQMERYADQERVVAELERRGARVEMEHIDWLTRSLGVDFAQLLDKLVEIHCETAPADDALIDYLVVEHTTLRDLRVLNLAGGTISDQALSGIGVLRNLHELDLRNTPITKRGLGFLPLLPNLSRLELAGTSVDWLTQLRLRMTYR